MNHSQPIFFKIIDSFRKENDWLYLWVVHWLTVSNHSFKNISSFRKDQVTLFMSESLNHLLKQFIQKRFILEQNKCMSLWASQWIIHTADLLKKTTPIHSGTKLMSEWIRESFTEPICSNTPIQSSNTNLFRNASMTFVWNYLCLLSKNWQNNWQYCFLVRLLNINDLVN